MAKISPQELPEIRKKYPDKKIVFSSGVFDLTHAGHALFFENCKKLGDILVVGIGSDAVVRRDKPGRPILNEHLRSNLVAALKPVDFAFVIDHLNTTDPWDELLPVFELLRPDIYVINDDAKSIDQRQQKLSHLPTKVTVLKRSAPPEYESVSTSNIIEKIKGLFHKK